MAISIPLTPAPTPTPSRDDPDNFRSAGDAYVDWQANDFVPEMNQVITDLNDTIQGLFVGTSLSSVAVGSAASKTFTMVEENLAFGVGNSLRIAATASPTTNYMEGVVTSYTKSTKELVVYINSSEGSGTIASWTMTLAPPIDFNRIRVWDDLTGAVSVPFMVEHDGGYYVLTSNLADVTADEPGSSGSAWRALSIVRDARTSNTILGAGDNGKLIEIASGTFSQTFDAAATLGTAWSCFINNSGTGTITLDPNSTETIDGATTATMAPGEIRLITCDGTNLFSVILKSYFTRVHLTSGVSWTCPEYVRRVKMYATAAGGGTLGSGTYYGAAGGGGGTVIAEFDVIPGTLYTCAIGAGVAASAPGGNTTFTANSITYTANGGGAGGSAGSSGGAGGSGSGTGAWVVNGQSGEMSGFGSSTQVSRGGSTFTGYGIGADGISAALWVAGANGGIVLELYK